eukprot:TRINITY_DN1473_c0_g2_i3.p1 TRINITY_DN1473_c0_g2~~TRINITY_DN1473_c0_g2_i3.p1  ORF type:complete len:117 (-),score=25.68 TRINITY_DN1473_c0_g2_i3:915-1265(-)
MACEKTKGDFETILKFFDIEPSGNYLADVSKIASIENISDRIQENFFKYMFRMYDTDNNGSINSAELRNILIDIGHFSGREEYLNLSDDQIADILLCLDKDQSGEIDFSEFLAWLS